MNIFSNIGITELIVILILALLVVGPERLPEMARKLAKTLRDVRQAYENLTKDLGPELMSIQETTREIRESVDSVRTIPKDAVGSVLKAADLEDTVKDLKEVEKSIQEAGKSVTAAGKMVQHPLDQAAKSAREALKPAAAPPAAAAVDSEAASVSGEAAEGASGTTVTVDSEAASVSGEAAEGASGTAAAAKQEVAAPPATSDGPGEEEADD